LSKAQNTTLSLRQLQQLAHTTSRILIPYYIIVDIIANKVNTN